MEAPSEGDLLHVPIGEGSAAQKRSCWGQSLPGPEAAPYWRFHRDSGLVTPPGEASPLVCFRLPRGRLLGLVAMQIPGSSPHQRSGRSALVSEHPVGLDVLDPRPPLQQGFPRAPAQTRPEKRLKLHSVRTTNPQSSPLGRALPPTRWPGSFPSTIQPRLYWLKCGHCPASVIHAPLPSPVASVLAVDTLERGLSGEHATQSLADFLTSD